MSRRELLWVLVALAVAIGMLPLAGGAVLWTHPLWLDELCCTVFPTIGAASPVQVVANIARGQDYAPPLLHLLVWGVGRLVGELTPTVLRSISVACVALALLFVYATLRRRFDRVPSAAAAVAVASHPLVLAHAFEARFYGPWLLFAAAFAWSLGSLTRRNAWLQATLAVCLVTIHWFGVLSLALMCVVAVAAVVAFTGRWREGILRIAPSGAGLLALAALMPVALAQRTGSSDFLWIPALSGAQIMGIAQVFFLTAVPIIATLLLALETLSPDVARPVSVPVTIRDALRDPGVAALGALAFMPVALVAVSILIQPSLFERYAIVTVLCWAPLVALALASVGRSGGVIALLLLGLLLGRNVRSAIGERRAFAELVRSNTAAYEQAKPLNVPIVFPDLHTIYPVLGPARLEPTRARVLDLPDSTLRALYPSNRLEWLRRRTRVEINSAWSHNRVYGFPAVVTSAELSATPRFLVLASDLRIPGGVKQAENWGRVVFPNHRVTRIGQSLSLFEKAP